MAVVNKVVVKGQSYDIEDAITKKGLSTEVTRATEAETELLARVQGTSDNSNPRTDPFKYLGSFSDINGDDLKAALDALHTTTASDNIEGLWRATLTYTVLEIQCIAIHYAMDRWIQVLKSPYRYVKSAGKFNIVNNPRYRILYRIFENPNGENSTENNVWSDWHDVEQDLEDATNANATAITNEVARAKAEETAIRTLISDLIGESPETLNSIHEIAAWILNDTTGAAAMAKQISENKAANEELLLRLQGDSENSRATTDPFVNLGNMRGISELVAYAETIIDNYGGEVDAALSTAMISGVYRAFVNTSLYEMKLNVLVGQGVLTQTITGILNLTDGVLSVGTTEVITVERYFQNGNGWSNWKIVASAEKLVSLGDDIKTAEAAAIEKGRTLAKRDLFIAAGALYNDTNVPVTRRAPWGESVQHLAGHYYLNGLGDITEDEMAVIYSEKYRLMLLTGRDRAAQQVKVRTFWVNQANDNIRSFYKITDPYMAFYGCTNLEVLTFVASSANFVAKSTAYMPAISSTINYMLGFVADCPKLKYISALNVSDIALMQPSWGTIPPFRGCVSLIEVSLFGLKCDVSFVDSPNISKRSVLYAIENGLPVTAITIILHAEAYARLAEDTDIVAALEAQPLVTLVSA